MNYKAKDHAVDFLLKIMDGNIREAYKEYVHKNFRHHNISFKGDADSLMHAMEENHEAFPTRSLSVKQTLQEGEKVMVHSHLQISNENESHNMAAVHIFLFRDEKIVELWDLAQAIPENAPNENGMF